LAIHPGNQKNRSTGAEKRDFPGIPSKTGKPVANLPVGGEL